MRDPLFIYQYTKNNTDYYKVNPKFTIYTYAIDITTGIVDKKKIVKYTLHHDLVMYKIHCNTNKFSDFWASEDHSLVIYKSDDNTYNKISPVDLLNISDNREIFNLVKLDLTSNTINYIPLTEINIEQDSSVTTAGDFTVEDYYTFITSDGVFVQDTIALYRPVTSGAIKECEKLWTINNPLSPANASLQFIPKQAIVYGIYRLSETEKGRQLLSKVFGKDIKEQLDSKKLVKELTDSIIKQGNTEILDVIKTLGFSQTVRYPQTLSLLDFNFKNNKQLTGDKEKDSTVMEQLTEQVKETFPKADIVNSGARASWDQVRQMVSTRGYVSNFWGKIVPVPIKSSYSQGLTPEDYFISCYGTRKALLDIAENTAKSGYLTRKMVYGCMSCELDKNTKDCKTETCAKIHVTNEKLANALMGRYYYLEGDDQLQHVTNVNDIMDKTILLRSPIFCTSKHICPTCYGSLYKIQHSKYIGVIAAQTLGERSTQLILRTFHTGGVAQGKKLDKQDDIASSLGDVSSFDKNIPIDTYQQVIDYTLNMWKLFSKYGNLHLVHFEIITAQRLWAELPDGRVVRVRTHLDTLKKYEHYDENGYLVKKDYQLILKSIHSVPAMESWFLGLAFQNVKENFIKAFIYPTEKSSIIEQVILGNI